MSEDAKIKNLESKLFELEQKCDNLKKLNEDLVSAYSMMLHNASANLTVIIGYSNLLLLDFDTNSEHGRNVNGILEAGELLNKKLRSFRDYIKLEKGEYIPKRTMFNLSQFLKNYEEKISLNYSDKKIKFNYYQKGNCNELRTYFAEPGKLKEAFNLLLENSCQAVPFGGVISLQVEQEEEDYLFKIKNEGAIPKQIKDKIFERGVTFGKKKGTGIGAYSAKLIVDAHKGSINYYVDYEKNFTEFIIKLPNNSKIIKNNYQLQLPFV